MRQHHYILDNSKSQDISPSMIFTSSSHPLGPDTAAPNGNFPGTAETMTFRWCPSSPQSITPGLNENGPIGHQNVAYILGKIHNVKDKQQ